MTWPRKKAFSMSASDLEQVELEQRLDKRCVFERIFSRNCTWHILALKYSRYCYTFGYSTFSLKRPFYTILISEQTDGSTDLQSDLSTDKQIEPLDRDARMHLHILIRWLIHHCLHVHHAWYTNVFLARMRGIETSSITIKSRKEMVVPGSDAILTQTDDIKLVS